MSDIVDLDILRPKKQAVRLAQKIIDVSYIPCGITFEIDKIVRELMALDQEKVKDGGEETRKALDLTIKMCVTFASVEYPEMNEHWFRKHVSVEQTRLMADVIKDALLKSYEGVKSYGKN
jgi:hypothetical protein